MAKKRKRVKKARKAVKRKTHKRKARRTVKRKTHKRKTVRRKRKVAKKHRTKSSRIKAVAANRKAHWTAFKHLQARVDKAWDKLKTDVKKKASPQTINKGKNHLMLLLGECNYMAREYMRNAHMKHRR